MHAKECHEGKASAYQVTSTEGANQSVQIPAKKCANLAGPGSQARAGRNFLQPRTIFLANLCLQYNACKIKTHTRAI